jgi:AcrR family transcriptional regulator
MDDTQQLKNEPRFERRKDARPSELTAAALELFVEKGFASTRLEDIAARAGVSKGTLYLYFDSKEELFKAVIRGGIVPAISEAEALIDKFEGSAADLVRSIVAGWYKLIGSTPLGGIPKLMLAEARNFPEIAQFYHDEVVARGLRMMSRALKRGIDSGEFRTVDLEHAVQVMMAPLIHFALWRYSFAPCAPRNLDPQRYLESYLEILIDGLKARRP